MGGRPFVVSCGCCCLYERDGFYNSTASAQYIAPKRLGTRAEEDAHADIYSLARVLYQCLTGSPPFAGDAKQDPELTAT